MLQIKSVSAFWNRNQPIAGYGLRSRSLRQSFRPGEWVFIAGRNGIGKTTLLHAIAGTVTYMSGEVLAGSFRLEHSDVLARFRASVQLVPQHPRLQGILSVDDAKDLVVLRRPALFNERAIDALIVKFDELGLVPDQDALDGRVFDLLCAVLAVPRVVLLDEFAATWSGVSLSQSEVYLAIKELVPRATVLFTEHHVSHALDVADEVLWLRKNELPKRFPTDDSELRAQLEHELGQDEQMLQDLDEMPPAGVDWRDVLRLDRSPLEQLQLAMRARGFSRLTPARRARFEALQRELCRDFPFLASQLPAESLSGGERTVLRWLLLDFTQIGELPQPLLHHLDRIYRTSLERLNETEFDT